MKYSTFKKFCKEADHNIRQNRVLSMATVIAMVSGLFVLGIIMLIVFNMENLTGGIESKVDITAFIENSLVDHEALELAKELESLEGIEGVNFISKSQGLDEWIENLGERGELLEGYEGEDNPLPHKLIISLRSTDHIDEVMDKLRSESKIIRINYNEEIIDTIRNIMNVVRAVGLGLVILLILIAVVIINNIVKVSIFSRKNEIQIMKYIGATNSYIRWPFLIEGFRLGFMSSLIAIGLVLGGYELLNRMSIDMAVNPSISGIFNMLATRDVVKEISLVFLSVALSVGLVTSFFSTNRYLRD